MPTQAPEEQLRKGLQRCALCQRVIRPAARKHPHEDSPECKAAQIHHAYDARDWVQVFNVTQGKILEEAGVPIEWALGGTHVEEDPSQYDEFGRRVEASSTRIVQHLVGFTPRSALRASQLLARIKLPSGFRRRALAALWNDPVALDALDSARRLTHNIRSLVYKSTLEAEERKTQ